MTRMRKSCQKKMGVGGTTKRKFDGNPFEYGGLFTTPGSPGTDIRSILMFISSPSSLSSLPTSRPPCLEERSLHKSEEAN